jgi:hypothetical protein
MGLAIAAAILRTACSWVGVTPPDFLPAMGICFLTSIVIAILQVGVLLLFGALGGAASGTQAQMQALAPYTLIAFFLVHPIASAGVYKVMLLDCSFGRGLMVWLAQMLVIAIIVGIIIAAAYGLQMLQKNAALR